MSEDLKHATDITFRTLFLCTYFMESVSLYFLQKVRNNDKILSQTWMYLWIPCLSATSAMFFKFFFFNLRIRSCWLSFLSVPHQQLPSSPKLKRSPSSQMNKSKRKRRRRKRKSHLRRAASSRRSSITHCPRRTRLRVTEAQSSAAQSPAYRLAYGVSEIFNSLMSHFQYVCTCKFRCSALCLGSQVRKILIRQRHTFDACSYLFTLYL